MLTALATILGAVTGVLPSIVKIFDRKQELQHERELLEIRLSASAKAADIELKLENAKAAAREGDSLRKHDNALDGGKFINTLRASVRPVITYIFFFMFVVIKGSAAYVMLNNGLDIPSTLMAIWDEQTVAIFGAVMGFWFGSRAFDKWYDNTR